MTTRIITNRPNNSPTVTAAVANERSLLIQQTGSRVHVPRTPIALLMYYLDCINSCLVGFQPSPEWKTLIDYRNHHRLSPSGRKVVIGLCQLLTPTLLNGSVMFVVPNSFRLKDNSTNSFLSITEAHSVLAAANVRNQNINETFAFKAERIRVTKVLLCKPKWIESNYHRPLLAIYLASRSWK
mmetsp:Transcript_6894/g.7555  ORF Transcript_6894/g.7555 Transcript_6894/m.7555 type:complete len:183 (+) Transcript_6894:25-573(+)